MSVFVDSSALYALLNSSAEEHEGASVTFHGFDSDDQLLTHSYVLLETAALAQSRLGMAAVRDLQYRLTPRLDVVWVDARLHGAAMTAALAAGRRGISVVDWTSFLLMREAGLDTAFTFDADFAKQGFEVIP